MTVAEEPLYVALPVEDNLAHATSLRLPDLIGRSLILFPSGNRPSFADAVLSALSAASVNLVIGAEAEDQTSALALVSIGRSEEHTSELQSLMRTSYAVFCLKKKKIIKQRLKNDSLLSK